MSHHRWLDRFGIQVMALLQTSVDHGTYVDGLKTFNLHYQMVRTLLRLRHVHPKVHPHLDSVKIWGEFGLTLSYILYLKCLSSVLSWFQTDYVASWTPLIPLKQVFALMETPSLSLLLGLCLPRWQGLYYIQIDSNLRFPYFRWAERGLLNSD